MSELDGVLGTFLIESHENLDALDRELIELEADPTSTEIVGRLFRRMHTIKATCGFFGFTRIDRIAHVSENVLHRLREGELEPEPEMISALLGAADAIRTILANVEANGDEGDGDDSELIGAFAAWGAGEPDADDANTDILAELDELLAVQNAGDSGTGDTTGPDAAPDATPVADDDVAAAIALFNALPDTDADADASTPEADAPEADAPEADAPEADAPVASEPEPVVAAAAPATPPPAPTATPSAATTTAAHSAIAESSVRVDVNLLDELMNLVGELVLARNEAMQYAARSEDPGFVATSRRINLITSELQERVMKTRMQPIGNVFDKFPRIVRDLCVATGKKIRLETDGRETELDRTLIEAIQDPLTHLVRNACDHGIEAPEIRAANGKSAEGRLTLRAFHEGGHVNIDIVDDGGGIDADRIRNRAVERGLVTADLAQRMSDREAIRLIFLPGFSTAEKITNISGRGVGMDVVKSSIEKIGGVVDVDSRPGEGSTFRLKIPLTLAIIPALIVGCGTDRFAIPQASLVELVRLEGDTARSGIELIRGAPVYRLRGDLLPLVDLRASLGLGRTELPPAPFSGDDETEDACVVNVVVLSADDRTFGLVVDKVHDTEEIVVKPLGPQLNAILLYAGATIMGDGKVALILDVLGLARNANVVVDEHDFDDVATGDELATAEASETTTLLLVEVGGNGGQLAVAMSNVARLEEFRATDVERSGTHDVVQYRGSILPLVRVADSVDLGDAGLFGGTRNATQKKTYSFLDDDDAHETVKVILYQEGDVGVGLVVDRIVDVVAQVVDLEVSTHRRGILGSAIVRDAVTDVLDVEGVIAAAGLDTVGAIR